MKKIISLLSAFAMIATMFTTVAMADENNYLDAEILQHDANTMTIRLYLQTNQNVASAGATYNLSNAVTDYGYKAADVTYELKDALAGGAKTDDTLSAANSKRKNILNFSFANTSGGQTGRINLMDVTFNVTFNVTGKKDYVLPMQSAGTVLKVTNADGENITSMFDDKVLGITIGPKAEEVKFTPAAGGNMVNPANGQTEKTYLTDIVEFNTDETAPTIKIQDEAGEIKTFDGNWYPTNLKGQGTIKVLLIVRYAGETEKTFSIVNE